MATTFDQSNTQAIWDMVKKEAKPLFFAIATFSGASTFLLILRAIYVSNVLVQVRTLVPPPLMSVYLATLTVLSLLMSIHWPLLAMSMALMTLPNAYARLKSNKKPLCIRFALAFAIGFLAFSRIVPDLFSWIVQVKSLLENRDKTN